MKYKKIQNKNPQNQKEQHSQSTHLWNKHNVCERDRVANATEAATITKQCLERL